MGDNNPIRTTFKTGKLQMFLSIEERKTGNRVALIHESALTVLSVPTQSKLLPGQPGPVKPCLIVGPMGFPIEEFCVRPVNSIPMDCLGPKSMVAPSFASLG